MSDGSLEVLGSPDFAAVKSPAIELISTIGQDFGFKNGRAAKAWFGSFGHGLNGDDKTQNNPGGSYLSSASSLLQTKYLNKATAVSYSLIDGSGNPHSGSIVRGWQVDRFSGQNKTVTSGTNFSPSPSDLDIVPRFANLSWQGSLLQFPAGFYPFGFGWQYVQALASPTPANVQSALTYNIPGSDKSTAIVSLTRTVFTLVQTWTDLSGGPGTFTLNISITYSGTYTAAQVHSDVDLLLLNQNICSLPWRKDSDCDTGKFSQHNEDQTPTGEPGFTVTSPPGPADVVGYIGPWNGVDFTKPPGTVLTTFGPIGQFSRGAFVSYDSARGGGPSYPGQLVKGQWLEKKQNFPAHNWDRPCGPADQSNFPGAPACSGVWNNASTKGNYVTRIWTFDYRDITITPSLRQATQEWKDVSQATHTITAKMAVLIAPADYGCGDYYNVPDTLILDGLGAYWQSDVSQVMFDPILPYVPPGTAAVSINNYNPVGAGAKLEECVTVQPAGSPAMPTNSRPLDGASGWVAALNAAYPNQFDVAPSNPEIWPNFGSSGGCGETGFFAWSAQAVPWINLP